MPAHPPHAAHRYAEMRSRDRSRLRKIAFEQVGDQAGAMESVALMASLPAG